jgi:hypothetical protein
MADWMAGAVKHPGALRATLGAKPGEPIPAAKLEAATHSTNPTTRRRAALAETFRHAHHAPKNAAAHHGAQPHAFHQPNR